jgi:hypothetical protein
VLEVALTGDDEAGDAEFAGFQASFVGGMSLTHVTTPSMGRTRRKARDFTIRFLPKKGLSLCWAKRDALSLALISEVVTGGTGLGGGLGGAADSGGSPRAASGGGGGVSFSRPSFSSGLTKSKAEEAAASDDDSLSFVLRYRAAPGLGAAGTPGSAGSPRLSREHSAAASVEGLANACLILEAQTREKRDHLARCFRRLANQERERSSFMLED